MSRRRGGRSSRKDRYGTDDDVKIDDTDVASAPYQLATDDGTAPMVGAPRDPTPTAGDSSKEERSSLWKFGRRNKSENDSTEEVPSEEEPLSPQNNQDVFTDEMATEEDDEAVNNERGDDGDEDDDDSLEGYDMTLQELMYSTSSFYAIVVPGTLQRNDGRKYYL
jgi:hypothetical protein